MSSRPARHILHNPVLKSHKAEWIAKWLSGSKLLLSSLKIPVRSLVHMVNNCTYKLSSDVPMHAVAFLYYSQINDLANNPKYHTHKIPLKQSRKQTSAMKTSQRPQVGIIYQLWSYGTHSLTSDFLGCPVVIKRQISLISLSDAYHNKVDRCVVLQIPIYLYMNYTNHYYYIQ